jgi:hypothetical protein
MAILAGAIAFAYKGLTVHSDLTMPVTGDIALGLGVLFSLLLGIGLMALLFYSSRAGYDDAPQESEHPRNHPPAEETLKSQSPPAKRKAPADFDGVIPRRNGEVGKGR